MNIRINNLNFDTGILTIHDGKGGKDRTLPLPETLISDLAAQIDVVKELHLQDLNDGYAGAFMFDAIEKKYKNAGKEFNWQWFFPAKTLTYVPETKEFRRSHTSTTVAKLINTLVVKLIGTWGNSLTSEILLKNNLNSIWDDRVLNHAYKIFGGIPDIHLENVQSSVPEKIIETLHKMTRYS